MQKDFLIVGQGLAGSLLAWELIRRGYNVAVIDSGQQNASLIAAGIINPVTGMRLALTVDVETLLPAALRFYAQLSEFFGQPFYHELPMLRLLRNKSEVDYSNLRLSQNNFKPYLEKLSNADEVIPEFAIPLGWLEQKQTGYLSTWSLLNSLKMFLTERQVFRQEWLSYQNINFTHGITWQDINARRIIFCEGHQSSQNPWFSWLPMQPAKGEILTIESELKLPNAILNYGNWLLPSDQNTARIGATFDRESINTLPTEQGKQSLLINLKKVSPRTAQSQVTKHQAGIRPCTADKFPFIGKHPHHERIMIFNGFGAKGSLQIPWYCQRFADHLQHHTALPSSCDIKRYQNKYFPG